MPGPMVKSARLPENFPKTKKQPPRYRPGKFKRRDLRECKMWVTAEDLERFSICAVAYWVMLHNGKTKNVPKTFKRELRANITSHMIWNLYHSFINRCDQAGYDIKEIVRLGRACSKVRGRKTRELTRIVPYVNPVPTVFIHPTESPEVRIRRDTRDFTEHGKRKREKQRREAERRGFE